MHWLAALTWLVAPPPTWWDLSVTSVQLSPSSSAQYGTQIKLTCAWSAKPVDGDGVVTTPIPLSLKFLYRQANSPGAKSYTVDYYGEPMIFPDKYSSASGASGVESVYYNTADIPKFGDYNFGCSIWKKTGWTDDKQKSNNERWSAPIKIYKDPLTASSRSSLPQAAAPGGGRALVPDAKTRACKGMVYANVQLDTGQFSPADAKPQSNPAKMSLDLVQSHALGDYVHCEYTSIGKDVKLVYTYPCPGAEPAAVGSHTYKCQ